MKFINVKKTMASSLLGLSAILAVGTVTFGQSRNQGGDRFPSTGHGQNQKADWEKQRQIELEKQKQIELEKQRQIELEKQRQYEEQTRLEQQRQAQLRIQYERNRSPWERNIRYKVYQNGRFFITDGQGLEMLKQAVIRGYEEGFKAGLADRNKKKRNVFNNFSVYKKANVGFQKGVEMKQYQFFFQKGFAEGYEDGLNARRFRGWFQNDGKLSDRELREILKYERF